MVAYIIKFSIDNYETECLAIAKNEDDARRNVLNNYLGAIITESKLVEEKMIVEMGIYF